MGNTSLYGNPALIRIGGGGKALFLFFNAPSGTYVPE